MAAAKITTATFPKFQNLPRELRDQIWSDSLPENDNSALYPWKKGCWCPRRLQKTDPEWDPNEDLNLQLNMCYDLLDHVRVEVPLFSVNWESRVIALTWMREQNITLHFHKDKQNWVFTRPFDPMMDALYIPMDKIDEFFIEPHDRMDEPSLYDQIVDIRANIKWIAVPAALFQGDVSSLDELFGWYFCLQGLSVIVGTQPCWESHDRKQVQGQRWEFTRTQGRDFVYNHGHKRFDLHDGGGGFIGDGVLNEQIEKACGYLSEMVVNNNLVSFEIQTVFATAA